MDSLRLVCAFLLFPMFCIGGHAQQTGTAKEEIDYLLSYVEQQSDVRFIRNGKEYGSAAAADHLRLKLSRAGNRVKTAEDFILGIATKSSISGDLYKVKLADGRIIGCGEWLSEALARHRQHGK